jgi:hypothetical protein
MLNYAFVSTKVLYIFMNECSVNKNLIAPATAVQNGFVWFGDCIMHLASKTRHLIV